MILKNLLESFNFLGTLVLNFSRLNFEEIIEIFEEIKSTISPIKEWGIKDIVKLTKTFGSMQKKLLK